MNVKDETALDERQINEAKKWINYIRLEKGISIRDIAKSVGYQSMSMLLLFIRGRLEPIQEKRVAARIMLLKETISEEDITRMKKETCPTCGQCLFV